MSKEKKQIFILVITTIVFICVVLVIDFGGKFLDNIDFSHFESSSEDVLYEDGSADAVEANDIDTANEIEIKSAYQEKLEAAEKAWLPVYFINGNSSDAIKYRIFRKGNQDYLFLPSHMRSFNGYFRIDNDYDVYADGELLTESSEIDNVKSHELVIFNKVEGTGYKVSILQSDNLPTVYINTESGAMDNLNEDKANYEKATYSCINDDGNIDSHGTLSMRARGYTSFLMTDKKGYKLNFDNKINILGMGSDENWVLLANSFDPTNIRNQIAYELAKKMDVDFAIEGKFVDVYYNGEYGGNYYLCENISVGKERVHFDNKGDFLLELTSPDRLVEGDNGIEDSYGNVYEIKYPKSPTQDAMTNMHDKIIAIDYLISGIDEEGNYEKLKDYLDMNSFAKQYIINQLTNEVDINTYSMFYWYDKTKDLIHAGPVWDFDRAWGGDVNIGKCINLNCFADGWSEKLFRNSEFKKLVKQSWNEYSTAICSMEDNVDFYSDYIRQSKVLDDIRCGLSPVDMIDYGDFDQNVDILKKNIGERVNLVGNDICVSDEEKDVYKISIDALDKTYAMYVKKEDGYLTQAELDQICSNVGVPTLYMENGAVCWNNMPVNSDFAIYAYNPRIFEQILMSQEAQE